MPSFSFPRRWLLVCVFISPAVLLWQHSELVTAKRLLRAKTVEFSTEMEPALASIEGVEPAAKQLSSKQEMAEAQLGDECGPTTSRCRDGLFCDQGLPLLLFAPALSVLGQTRC